MGTLREAFKKWQQDTMGTDNVFAVRPSEAWKAAIRYCDEQGWLQHGPGCPQSYATVEISTVALAACTCGLDATRKEAGE